MTPAKKVSTEWLGGGYVGAYCLAAMLDTAETAEAPDQWSIDSLGEYIAELDEAINGLARRRGHARSLRDRHLQAVTT